MRLNVALVFSIIIAVGIVALGFTFYQTSTERSKLVYELELRTSQVAEEFSKNELAIFDGLHDRGRINFIIDSLSLKYQLLGIALFYNEDSVVSNSDANKLIKYSLDFVRQAMISDTVLGNFVDVDGQNIYLYIRPFQQNEISTKSLILFTNAGYINNIINDIWFRNFLRWFLQALVVSLITVFIVRWGIFSPINNIVEWVRAARSGNVDHLGRKPVVRFLVPLQKEIINIAKAMQEAKAMAEEEARLRTNSESVWTPERLKAEVGNLLQNKKMIVVSNREPIMHVHEGKNIKSIVPASGMITAMEPILNACGGLWIASGTGDADRETVDRHDKILVPPENPKYTLRRVWQSKQEETHFYYGFSNEGLWPLCHIAHTRPTFREEDWHYYKEVNEKFARAVIEESADEDQPFVLIQDYHFALLPELIKKEKPNAKVAIFWHIPWPNPESFGICPWQREILTGMLGADLIGFHTQYHCNHFLETVNNALESRVGWENFTVNIAGHSTLVKPFPISIDFTLKEYNKSFSPKVESQQLLNEHGISAKYMGVGVDRIDYTKGIVEKFLAIERFLEKYPSYVGKFTFVQIGAPSRTLLKTYSDIVSAVEKEAERINWRFKSRNWKPILLLKKHHSHEEILPFYEAANVCIVSSLHDGMNLVAKEFVAARNTNDGVLILSQFAGASHELHGAIVINPYDIEKAADAIKDALEMPFKDQQLRMNQMRQLIVGHNIYSWAAELMKTMGNI